MSPSSTIRRHLLQAAALPWLSGVAHAQAPTLPAITLRASDGAPVLGNAPADNRWRAAWIDIWASWCGPCKLSFPWMNEMHARYAAQGLRIIAVNVDRHAADAEKFLRQQPAAFALAMDPTSATAKALEAKAMPSSWLVRPDRSLLLAHGGFRLDERGRLERAIRDALGL